jgi:hypothetical protein
MSAKHVAFFTLSIVIGAGCTLSAQSTGAAPPALAPTLQAPRQAPASSDPYAPSSAQGIAQAPDTPEIDFSSFFAQLSPYGQWVLRGDYGWVWLPAVTSTDWRPYTIGHWATSDYGWAWMSDEPFGWATYHYGRWIDDPDDGWMWSPGYHWGPAWVAWRAGAGYVGWAPLSPADPDSDSVGSAADLPSDDFSFVPETSFLNPLIVTFVLPPSQNVTIIQNTTYIINRTIVNNRLVNTGLPVKHFEDVTHHRAERLNASAIPAGGASARPPGDIQSFSISSAPRQSLPFGSIVGPAFPPRQPQAQTQTRSTFQPQQPSTAYSPTHPLTETPQRAIAAPPPNPADQQTQQQREQQTREQRQSDLQAQQQQAQQQRQAEQQAEQQRQAEQQAQQQRQAEQQAQQQRDDQAREQQRQTDLQAQQQREQQQRQAEQQAQQQRDEQAREQQRQADLQAQQQREQQQRQAEQQAQQQRDEQAREQQRQAEVQAQQQRDQQQQQARQQAEQNHSSNPPPSHP